MPALPVQLPPILANIDRDRLEQVCRAFSVTKLAVFGSVARGEAREDSDIDLLYELSPGRTMGFIALEAFAESLGDLFGGRRIDLGTPAQLHWYVRRLVTKDLQVIYEE